MITRSQVFSQRLVIDYDETYAPIINAIKFSYLSSLPIFAKLEMLLMDVVTAYLYGLLDSDIYMRILDEFKMLEASSPNPKKCIRSTYKDHYMS